VPDPATGSCVAPYHDQSVINAGGPHAAAAAVADIDGGRMDGFIAEEEKASGGRRGDVMGYHDAHEIPNYWNYAQHYVLQDHMFEPNASWSLPEHLFMVSEWSAQCTRSGDPASCSNSLDNSNAGTHPDWAWTDLT